MVVAAVRQFFVKYGIPPSPIVAAISGGADSTALLLALDILRAEGYGVEAVHVNHHLRGAASDDDEAFVRDLCARLRVTLRVADGTLDPERVRAHGIEGAARETRYTRLTELRGDARYIATAHQRQDQAETVLMRLLTGSGIAGLRGIHPTREDGFIRPLLEVDRASIERFLREQSVRPRYDLSNDDPRFLRNRVRGFLRQFDATDSLATLGEQARQQWPILERAIDDAERECARVDATETRFERWPENAWLRQALLHRHIRRLGEARDVSARDLLRLGAAVDDIRRVSVTKTLELVRRGDALVLRRKPEQTNEFLLDVAPGQPAFIAEIATTMHLAEPAGRGQRFQVPSHGGCFTVRNRRRGDRFQPLGLPQPKKLKDFLIDRRIPADARDRLPLLLWNGEIVWVAGVEISERFKVSDVPGVPYEVWLEGS